MLIFKISTILIGVLTISWWIRTWYSDSDWKCFGPFGIAQLSYAYYCCLGPTMLFHLTDMELAGSSLSRSIAPAADMALVSLLCCWFGYFILCPHGQLFWQRSQRVSFKFSLALFGVMLVIFSASQGFRFGQIFNFLGQIGKDDLISDIRLGGFENYFFLLISTMIGPLVLMSANTQQSTKRIVITILCLLVLLAIILTTGFRLRIAFLALCLMGFIHLRCRCRKDWFSWFRSVAQIRMIVAGILAVALLVIMSLARKYDLGVDVDKVRNASQEDVMLAPFKDSHVYFVSGKVKKYVDGSPARLTYFEPVISTFIRAIPTGLYGEKPFPKTVEAYILAMGDTLAVRSAGFAALFYAEHYLQFGWFGLCAGSFLLGVFCALIEKRALRRRGAVEKLLFILSSSYVFVYFHRGFLPQQVEFFVFMVVLPVSFYKLRCIVTSHLKYERNT